MEKIRQTAVAHYARSSSHLKNFRAKNFSGADGDGDGRITFTEFVTLFMLKDEHMRVATRIFQEFDRDHNHVYAGTLDFEQVISIYYLVATGRVLFCDGHGCDEFLKGAYFTCKQCFPTTRRYHLCCNCFRTGNFTHHHQDADICDNYALLMRSNVTSSPQRPIASSSVPPSYSSPPYSSPPFTTSSSTGDKAKKVAVHVLKGADAAFKGYHMHHMAKAAGCSIM